MALGGTHLLNSKILEQRERAENINTNYTLRKVPGNCHRTLHLLLIGQNSVT